MPVYHFKYKRPPPVPDENGEIIEEPQYSNCYVMANDFNAAYPTEKDPLLIDTGDIQGVAWGCIRALKKEIEDLKKEVNLLKRL